MSEAFEDFDRTDDIAGIAPQGPRRDINWVFLGPHGLRAGWSVLLFAAIFICTDLLIGWLLHGYLHKLALDAGITPGHMSAMPLGFGFVQELLQASGMVVATVVMAFLEKRPLLAYGYQGRARTVRLFSGLGLGFVAIAAYVLVLWKAHLLSLDGQSLHGAAILGYGAGWGLLFLLVAVFEESLLRGYVQFTLMRGIGFWWGALLFSFLFGFAHGSNPGETPVGLFSAGAVGLVFCLSLWYTGSLWWAVGFHAAWDWGQSYFFGTSDSGMVSKGHLFSEHPVGNVLWSGGVTGPEGSLLVLPLLTLIAVCMWLWWGRRAERPFAGAAWRPARVGGTFLTEGR